METKQTKENRHQWRRNFYCNSNIIRVKKIHYILWSSLLPSGMCFNIMSMLYSFLYPQCPSNFRTYEHEFQLRSMWIPSNLPKVMKLISQKWKKKKEERKMDIFYICLLSQQYGFEDINASLCAHPVTFNQASLFVIVSQTAPEYSEKNLE